MRRFLTTPYAVIWFAVVALFVLSAVLVPASMTPTSLLAMLPFAAILAVIAAGQTMVAQQGGIDLSVSGAIGLSATLVTKVPGGNEDLFLIGVAAAVVAGGMAGMITGLSIAWGRLTPIVATIAANALLLGLVRWYSGGFPSEIAPVIATWAVGHTLGAPNLVLAALLLVGSLHILLTGTVFGRRFEAVGASRPAAFAAGIHTERYLVLAYTLAGICYALSGIMLAAYLRTPGMLVGESYLLPSVAAVVLGGTALSGGPGSVIASAAAALFLTQLGQVVLALNAPTSAQWIFQAATIAIGMALREFDLRAGILRLPRWRQHLGSARSYVSKA
jgi:ribose transport system permease protein